MLMLSAVRYRRLHNFFIHVTRINVTSESETLEEDVASSGSVRLSFARKLMRFVPPCRRPHFLKYFGVFPCCRFIMLCNRLRILTFYTRTIQHFVSCLTTPRQ